MPMNDAPTRHALTLQHVYGFVDFQIREKFNKNKYNNINQTSGSYLLTVSGPIFLLDRF